MPTFTLFERLSVQKDTLFKTSNIVKFCTLLKTQDPKSHTLFTSVYPLRPNKGVPSPRPHRERNLVGK